MIYKIYIHDINDIYIYIIYIYIYIYISYILQLEKYLFKVNKKDTRPFVSLWLT